MGQQQLLLVILVTVIVGIATVVAINTFSSASIQANRDAVTNDVVAIAAGSQAYYLKPAMLSGGNKSFEWVTFRKFGFTADSISTDSLKASNINGAYRITSRTADEFEVTAIPSSCVGYVTTAAVDAICSNTSDYIIATVILDGIEWD